MNKETELTSEESLKIISKMIKTAQGNVREGSFYFLFWGWIVVIACLGHFYLDYFTDFKQPYMVWLVTIPGWVVTMIYAYKQSGKERVKTYSDSILMWVWLGFMFSILIIIFGGSYFNYRITVLIMIFAGFATFVSGIIIRFKPLIIGGSSFWILAPISLVAGIIYAPLLMALGIVAGYLIPGYMLKKRK